MARFDMSGGIQGGNVCPNASVKFYINKSLIKIFSKCYTPMIKLHLPDVPFFTPICAMFKGDRSLHKNTHLTNSSCCHLNVKTYIIPLSGLETCEKGSKDNFPLIIQMEA